MQIYPAKDDTNLDDIYSQLNKLGGISKNPEDDEGVQLIKISGKVEPAEIGKHIQLSENAFHHAARISSGKRTYK
jgi:hypothetical protein